MLFDGWSGLLRVVVVGTGAYVALVALLNVSGKRTLAELSAFDGLGGRPEPVLRAAREARADPVFRDGPLQETMRRERVTLRELEQAARSQGYGALSDVSAIVLEPDGSLSVLTDSSG